MAAVRREGRHQEAQDKPMSLMRQDPTTKEWVIIATERDRRPHDFERTGHAPTDKAREPSCPFCPGNEALMPPELLSRQAPQGKGWAVRVTSNKFAALRQEGELLRRNDGPLFREMDGVGSHEVIVETPVHNRVIPLMEDAEVEQVLSVYHARYQALREDPRTKYIIIFKNHGERAGTSLEHPHSQVVATPVAPMLLRRRYEVAISHYDDTGRCLYCDLVEAEVQAKARLIMETGQFVVFHPFASRVPFETWIAPKRHQPSFGQVASEDLVELARVLRKTLHGLYRALGNPDFNYIIHSAPAEDENKAYYLWHLQILPRLATIAGFELGSGIYITTIVPEESAAFMRNFLAGLEAG